MLPKLRPITIGLVCFIFVAAFFSLLDALGLGFYPKNLALYLSASVASLVSGYFVREKFSVSMLLLGISMAGTLALANLVASYLGLHTDLGGLRMLPTVFWLCLPFCIFVALLIGSAGNQLYEYLDGHKKD